MGVGARRAYAHAAFIRPPLPQDVYGQYIGGWYGQAGLPYVLNSD